MLQNLGNLGEFVGAIGVVISLVYLARQTMHNTKAVRAQSFNSMVQNSIQLLEHAFRDSEFAAFLARAEVAPEALSPEERVRWDAYMTAVYRHFGNLVYAYRVGTLDRQMWESYRRTLGEHLKEPSWAAWYEANADLFSSALTELVEELQADHANGSSGGR